MREGRSDSYSPPGGINIVNVRTFLHRRAIVRVIACAFGGALLCAAGCGSTQVPDAPSNSEVIGTIAKPNVSSWNDAKGMKQLDDLWQVRMNDSFSSDFAVGPGDVLQVTVPEMEELKGREVRVSGDNTIALPVLGSIQVGGMTEQQVREAIKERLGKYMRDPEADVFVKEYQSRMVAVEGMVQKPGLYGLKSRSDTVMDVISRAGGMLENASTRVIFVPANTHSAGMPLVGVPLAASSPTSLPVRDSSAPDTGREKPERILPVSARASTFSDRPVQIPSGRQGAAIVINLSAVSHESHLDVPVRPGDVIIVPAAGQVMVKGWVQSPGAYRIVPGMTVLGAVTAAGGEMFSSSAELLRSSDTGEKIEIPVNLSNVQSGREPDVTVQSGDVVVVEKSAAGAVPYAFYEIFTKFNTGIPIMW